GPARTGRPGIYCGQACRQAALRRRRLADQAPRLREEAQELLAGIGPELATTGQQGLEALDGEQLAQVVRHARAAREHLAALYGALDVLPDRTRSPGPSQAARHPLPGRARPDAGPGQAPASSPSPPT
ncbi:hypothetical protein ACFWOG_15035, partial [Kitasatospora sp. NPDC058406]|uniref:hypothetical protein n=1 Tax=Kitasatospora sp. NPDC058406 TaxID=3346483 RepID=UPI00364A12C0